MQLHEIKSDTRYPSAKRVGRGGKRGTYSGRGIKGQKARSGHRIRPQLRDILNKIPMIRGKKFNVFRAQPVSINVGILEVIVSDDTIVTPEFLLEKGLITKSGGKMPRVKILGYGDLAKRITIEGCDVSKGAKDKIEKAGGSVHDKDALVANHK
jgi:large subunit ribosomal protein L15